MMSLSSLKNVACARGPCIVANLFCHAASLDLYIKVFVSEYISISSDFEFWRECRFENVAP